MKRFLEQVKKLKEEEKNTNLQVIINHLIGIAEVNEQVKNNLDKEKKHIKKCAKYIYEKAREQAVNNVAMIEDSQVFEWALNYYNEDDLEIDQEKVNAPSKKENKSKKEKIVTDEEGADEEDCCCEIEQKRIVPERKTKNKSKAIENQGSLF